MIRIKTMIGKLRVYTIPFNGKWFTIYNGWGDSKSADNLFEAGQNHLQAVAHMKSKVDENHE